MKTFKYNEFLKINEEDLSHKPTKVINKYDSILGTDFYNLINNIVTTKNDIDNFIKENEHKLDADDIVEIKKYYELINNIILKISTIRDSYRG
jgi:hypothetical protein